MGRYVLLPLLGYVERWFDRGYFAKHLCPHSHPCPLCKMGPCRERQ
jgi:hypothetical protein